MGYVEDLRGKKQSRGRPRWRARYRDPSGRERSKSFARKVDAERWERTTATLRPSTRKDYQTLLRNQVLPAFGDLRLVGIDALLARAGAPPRVHCRPKPES